MEPLTYFTAKLDYKVVVADESSDVDYDPQVEGPMAGVTITAYVVNTPPPGDDISADEIPATDLSPTAAMVVLAPIKARLDNGRLMLRVDPDLVVHWYVNMAAFPATGVTTQYYGDGSTELVYKWNGTAYEETDQFVPVRLTAATSVLELPVDAELRYRVEFWAVTFNGKDQTLPAFAFAAPSTDVVLDLAVAERFPA